MSKNKSTIDLTSGSISLGLVKFALPLMAGNVLQQCYNLTGTLVVGRFIGKNALAAVGSAYTLMIFLTSIILGLSMGCGAFLSMKYGAKEDREFAIGNSAIPPDLPLPVFSLEYYSLHLAGSRTRAGRGRVSLSHRHFPVLCRPWLNHLCLAAFSTAPF